MNYSYNMGDVIGKGFSSVVYRGVNDSTQETVAIKVIFMNLNFRRLFSDNSAISYPLFRMRYPY